MKVSETFLSRQGEGKLTGTESIFVRTSGCNLRCWFCDTPYASWNPEGERRSIESIVAEAVDSERRHVVLTGGEPLLPIQSTELCQELRQAGLHVTIETSGSVDREIQCDLMSISPKFASSTPSPTEYPKWAKLHEQRRMPIDSMRRLIDQADDYQLKFVAEGPKDFNELVDVVERLRVGRNNVWVMPQGVTIDAMDAAAAWLRPWCEANGFQYCDRMQIRWYGNRRGT